MPPSSDNSYCRTDLVCCQEDPGGVAAGKRAVGSSGGGESRVNVGFVVDAGADKGALCEPYRVATGEHRHVLGGQALGCEHGDEGWEVGEW